MAQLVNAELVENLKPFFPTRREWHARISSVEAGAITSIAAGAGLTGGGSSGTVTLDVNPGDGIEIATDTVAVNLSTISGLEFATGELQIADSIAGTGLLISSKVLSVDLSALDFSGYAGDGLSWDAGNTEFDLGTPSTLTVSTSNAVTASSHTHAITSSSNPGAASSLLASDASGYLTLTRLGIGGTPSYALDVTATTTQMHVEYDATHYLNLAVDTSDAIFSATNTIMNFITSGGTDIYFAPSGDSTFSSGNVGIGVFSPSYKLQVRSTTAPQFRLEYDSSYRADFSVSSTGDLTITANGGQTIIPYLQVGFQTTTGTLEVGYDASNYLRYQVAANDVLVTTTGITDVTYSSSVNYAFENTGVLSLAPTGTVSIDPTSTVTIQGSDLYLQPDTGNITFDPAGNDLLPATNYDLNFGALTKKYLTIHAAELWVETLVAQETIATIGGRILVGPTTELIADLSASLVGGSNLVTNGNMETWVSGDPSDYSIINSSLVTQSTDSHGGTYAARMESDTNQTYIYQDISVSTSTNYVFELWVKGQAASSGLGLPRFSVYDNANATYIYDNVEMEVIESNWTRFYGGFRSASNATTTRIYVYAPRPVGRDSQGAYLEGGDAATTGRDSQAAYLSGSDDATTGRDSQAAYLEGGEDYWIIVDDISLAAADYFDVKHNEMADGDIAYMEENGSVEFFRIMGTYSAITGGFRYSIERNLDGSGANAWVAGAAVFNTGNTADGFIDLYSFDGVKGGGAGPTIVGNIRKSTTYNDWGEHWAIGNLNGLYGYGTDTYGVGLGDYTTNHVTIDETNGIRFFDNAGSVVSQWSETSLTLGNTALGQYVSVESAGISFYSQSSRTIHLQSDGDAAFGVVQTGYGNVLWNATNKRLEFRGGTDGKEVSSYIDTNGSFVAGEGAVILNQAGLKIYADLNPAYPGDSQKRIEFLMDDGLEVLAALQARHYSSTYDTYSMEITLEKIQSGTVAPYIELRSTNDPAFAGIYINSGNGSTNVVHIEGDLSHGGGTVRFSSTNGVTIEGGIWMGSTPATATAGWAQFFGDVGISSGLYVGDATTHAGDGQIIYTGDLTASRSSAEYTGYIYVPLADYETLESGTLTPGSNTSTGTALSTPSGGNIPAAAKAVELRIFVAGGIVGSWIAYGPSNTATTDRFHAACYSHSTSGTVYNGTNAIVKINGSVARRIYRFYTVTTNNMNYTALITGYFI